MNSLELVIERMRKVTFSRNDSELAKKINNKNPSLVSMWKKRGTIPFQQCYEIAKKYNVSMNYLIDGEEREEEPEIKKTITKTQQDYSYIPHCNVIASAGSGFFNPSEYLEGEHAFRKDWLLRKGLDLKKIVTLKIQGDSMHPELEDGALCLVDLRPIEFIVKNKPYIISINDVLMAKFLFDEEKVYQIISANKDYPIYKKNKKEVIVHARVVWNDRIWI